MSDTDTDMTLEPAMQWWRRALPASGAEQAGALLLLVATIIAIAWANLSGGYEQFWDTDVRLSLGDTSIHLDLYELVNDGLMAFFFFAVGLEVKRELTIGTLTNRSRAVVPAAAAAAGLVLPALVFWLVARDSGAGHAWGVVISTDTAFLVGALAIIGPKHPARLRVFLLTLAVVDDIGALAAIAIFYTDELHVGPFAIALAALALIALVRFVPSGRGPLYATLAIVVWFGLHEAGVHATLAGVAVALLIPVASPRRHDVERVVELTRAFRQSPSPAYAAAASRQLRDTISINERLHRSFAPYIAFVILPVFALANAGVVLDGPTLERALSSSLTWGVVAGLVVGKLVGITGATLLVQRAGIGVLAPGLTIGRVAGGAALSGIGFTISLLIVGIAIESPTLQDEARVGVLLASVIAFALGAVILRSLDHRRPVTQPGAKLLRPFDPKRDHFVGRPDAPLVLVEYGDFECPFCSKATGMITEVLRHFGDDVAWVWRHLPLHAHHPHAELAARAYEAADRQGHRDEMSRILWANQDRLERLDLLRYADEIGLDLDRFESDLDSEDVAARVTEDEEDADLMDLGGTPTFFVGTTRHVGHWDAPTIIGELEASRRS
ncbi:Na+/H+ antiporter NhaA [Aeromicrobium wangtongii]|uniref:Na+/H+ antiporter NhaA n=1 Tax=Aeromicrobium wangtongii TaxID=2969247 RepID=UPI002016BDD0|nr:Na+/H+ antiporter NhaA [Aeromicrobium wangtongii]MCL3820279.1 Na+/H+ antiporter NhaA [Aeromicrobium wangtongii]